MIEPASKARASALAQHAVQAPRIATYEDAISLLDTRTCDILERRRRTAVIRRRGWLVRRLLLLADIVALLAAFLLASLLFQRSTHGSLTFTQELLVVGLTLPAWVVVSRLYGLYSRDDERADHSTADDTPGVFHMVTVGGWLFFGLASVLDLGRPNLDKLIVFWALAIGMTLAARAIARHISRRSLTYLQNTVIVGAGNVGQLLARRLLRHPEYGVNLIGFIDAAPRERSEELRHVRVLGPPGALPALIRLFDVERVIVAFSGMRHEATLDLVRSLKSVDVQVDIVPRLFEVVGPGVDVHAVGGVSLLSLPSPRLSRSSRLLKRVMDIVVAAFGLIALSPVLALIALIVKLESPGPVFFRQLRVGARSRPFRIWKFRSMSADADGRKRDYAHLNQHARPGGDSRMFKIPEDPRVTRSGRFLRRHSLDELPQLMNVLRGEMSLVGPRPLVPEEHRHVEEWACKRLDLKPGITGLWQVVGRSDIPFDEMVRLDYLYVTTWSLWNDCRLLARTLPAVVRANGGY